MGSPNIRMKGCISITSVIGAFHLRWRSMLMHFRLTPYVAGRLPRWPFWERFFWGAGGDIFDSHLNLRQSLHVDVVEKWPESKAKTAWER